ncbi:aminotransferase [Puccinia sorghi]|uniref:Aminotransferase n=1 Tax=Puccinia sorghi TaxID=27349 RepID=A0A0L6U9W6_9BASI|nr:aminotransferase [Puccinia sorghi]
MKRILLYASRARNGSISTAPPRKLSIKPLSASNTTMSSIAASEKVQPELDKGLDCWSVFSPASGHMPAVRGFFESRPRVHEVIGLPVGILFPTPNGFHERGSEKFDRRNCGESLQHPEGTTEPTQGRVDALFGKLQAGPSVGLRVRDRHQFRSHRVSKEVLIFCSSVGANFGIYASLLAFCSKDDEVILIEPFFDQYVRNVTFCGGKPVYVPLRPPSNAGTQNVSSKEWKLDIDELKAALTPKSKVIIINTPHNPVGKVFTEDELNDIGKVAEEHNLLIIADEVYDCLTFNEPHVRIASLSKSLWGRTVTVGSAGKSFAATGWRIGWCIGPAELLRPITAAMTRITFCSVSPLQEALAHGFQIAKKENFFETQRAQYEARRDLLLGFLDQLGLPYTVFVFPCSFLSFPCALFSISLSFVRYFCRSKHNRPDGSYFVLVESSKVKIPSDFEILSLIKTRSRDWHMCWFIAKVAGVVVRNPLRPKTKHEKKKKVISFCFLTSVYVCSASPPRISTHRKSRHLTWDNWLDSDHTSIGENFIRIAFCKDLDTLKEAGQRLQKLKPYIA